MRKIKCEFTQRPDGQFNVWHKVDHFYGDDRAPHYGTWQVIHVADTRDEAIAILRTAKNAR